MSSPTASPGARKAIVLVIGLAIAAVLVPVGVQAVTSSVSIADPVKAASKARVVGGRLEVASQPAAPTTPISAVVHLTETNRHVSLAGPFSSSNVFDITSLTYANAGTSTLQVRIRVMAPTTSSCDSGSTALSEVETVVVPGGQTVSSPFPTPLQARGPCVTALLPGTPPTGSDLYVTMVGYR